jgi:hypothetical protein
MGSRPGTGDLRAAQAGLEQVCALLKDPMPAALEDTAAILSSVVAQVVDARRVLQGGSAGARLELSRVRRAAMHAAILLEKASTYHSGWTFYLGSRTGGYRPDGGAAELPVSGCFSVHG